MPHGCPVVSVVLLDKRVCFSKRHRYDFKHVAFPRSPVTTTKADCSACPHTGKGYHRHN